MKYPLTTVGAMKILSNISPNISHKDANIKFVDEFDSLEEAYKIAM